MSKQFYFFKKAARNRLEDNTFWTLWELVESWTQNDWLAIFFIIFLGIIFEIILIKICTSFNKKPALPEKGSSSAQEKENNCLKSVKFDNWPIPSSSEERVDDFSERTIASSLTSEENESNFEDRVLLADEVIWLSTSESKYQVSHFSESHITSSNGTSSSLSLFHSEVKEFFPSHGGYPENEHETIQFSSKKLFSTLKTNKNKNLIFSSDFNFSRNSRRSIESEDLNVAPCPPAHLFLSRDQVRILEENVRNQVALKSKTTSKSKTTYLCSRFQESPIQNQHSVTMDISAQAQDSLPGQNAIQNQGFYEARFTSQVQQFVNNQESVNSQPDIMVFALPRDLTRKPFCSSTQESFQTQEKDRSQHLVNVSYSVETQDSIKGLESDKNQFDEAQYSFCFEDSNKSKHLIEGQNAIFKNSRCLVLTVSPNALAEGMLQIESVKPEGQKQITSSELNQYFTYGSGPLSRTLFKRQKNRRKTLHSKSKFSLIVLSQKSKKTQVPLVFQITVCHTSKPSKLGCKYNAKKELHQRKSIPDTALHLTYVSKPVPPYIKKYSRKELVKVMPGVTGCRHSLSLDAENVNDAGSTEKRRTSGRTGDIKQHGRENEGQKTISPKTSPQLEQSFNNIFQLKSPCFSLIEMNWKNKESLKGPITQAKGIGIAEFHAPNSKKTSDLHIPKQEAPLEDIISEPWQKFVSSPKVESNRRMKIQEDLRSTENSHLPLLGGKKLPTSSPETRRYFPDGSTQKQEDFLEIVLETSEVNLFISLGIKEYKDSEQLASIKTQKSTEDVIMKEKKPPVTLHATEGDNPSDSEGLEYNSRSNVKNMQGERIFATFLDATNTNVSEPLDMKMHSRLKAKTDKTTTGSSHSVVKLKKLPDEKKIRDAKYIEKRCIFKKPQERVREEEEQILEEGVPQLPQDFRLSLQLKQKPKYLRFDIKQSSPGSGETQNKEQEVQPQTLPTETVLVTSPCPTMDPFQVEVKQSAERLTGRETTDPENPLTVLENSRVGEVLIETRECGIPFGGSPRKTMDDHIAEEKTDLKRVLSAIALGSFIIHMLPLSYFKRQKIRKKLSGAKRLLSPKSVIRKVKKSTNLLMLSINRHGTASLRKRLRANFKILIKQMLQDKIVADVLVNVTYTHMFILSHSRTHSRLNAENCSQTELKQEKSKDEKEKKYSINKSSYSRYTLEEVKLQDEVRGDEAPPEAVLHDSWNLRMDANPEKELKMEEVPQTITSRESLMESVSYTLDGTQNKGLQCSFKMKMKNVRDKKEEEGKHETLPAPENSQHFIFNAYQNCGFIKSDEELKETQSINIQVQPQTHDKQTILGSTSCPVLDQFQFGNLESYARFSPPKSGEGKIDEIIFSTREYSVPSDSNHQKEQAGGTEKKDTVTFNFCIPALSTLKRKRNFKKYSDTKTLVNLKCGILKAKKPPVSYIFSIKGGVSPNHRKELGCNSTTKMVEVDQSEKMEAKTYSSVTITTPNLNMYSKIEREKGMLGETSLSSKQVKQAIPPNEGKIISDDTKKNSLQDEEKVKKKQETLKVIPQHSQHFKFHSGQRKELDLHQSEGQGSVIEQDISHRMQPTDSMQGEKPKKSHQTQNGAIYTASSKLPLLKSKESLIGEILMDTMMVSVLTVGSHKGKLYSHGKEENAGLKTVLESLDVSTPDLSESKRQRKTFTCRALKNKMNPKCVVMKAKKAPISLIFNISGNGCLKKLCPKILKSQVIDLLIHIKCSGVLEDLIAERKEGLAQELPATVPESLDLSTFALPALKRKRNNLKYIDRDKMSLEWVTSKAKKAPISQTLTISKRGTPSHKKQFKYNLKIMMKQGKPTADMTLNAISSPVPVLLDVKMYNRIKAESDVSWKMRFSHELQQREQSPDGEKACSADSSDNRGLPSSSTKEVKDQHEEAALRNSQHSSFIAGKMKKPHFVKSELEVKNLARENVTEPLNTAQELQQQTLFTKSVLHRVSCSILNSLPLEKLPKRTKTQKGLKYAKSPKILYPALEKSIRESLIVTTRSDILSERGPRKELASSIPEVKLQKDLQARTLKCFDFSTPASSEFEGQRNAAQIPKSRNGKAQVASVLKTINIPRSGALSHGKEQDFILKNTAKEISQDIEMHSTSKAEMDQPRVKLYSHTSVELGKSPGDGEVWKADSIDTQNRSSNTIKRNVQHKKEEENIQKMLSESVPDYNQHFSFSAYHMKNPGSYQSESELNNSEVRNSWNLSYTAQKMRQEKCFRETILEPVSRHVMNFLQVETVKSHHAQEEIKCMEGVKTPFPKVRKSKTGSIQCGARWDRNPRRKWDSSIFERKAWNQNDLVRTVLKPSNFSSFDSSEPKNQRYTLEFEGNKTIINPKYVTLKAKKQPVLQLLDITRCFTGSHRKTMGCKFQYKMKKRQWFESVSEASLLAEGTEIPPPKLVTDKHSFSATARDTLYNRPLHRNLHGHITKEKAELRENSATTFQGPLDFFMPILSDSESQINTVQLLEEKITLNLKCLTMKERDPVNSQMLKIRGRFTTKRRKKLGSNLKAKMQQMSQSKNVADTFPNTGYFTPDTSDIKRQSRLKIGMDRVSRFSGVQPTQMELPVEGLEKKIERKREKTVLNVDLKFMYDSMPILSHTKMEESPGTWGIYEESSEKRNTLSKANASSAYACTPMHPKIIKHKAKVKTADVENTLHTSRVTLKAKRPPVSKLFDSVTTRYGTRRNKMELRCYIKAQKEFQQYKTVTDLFLNTIYGSGSVSSQIKQFTEVKGEKDRSGKPMYITPQLELEKSLNKRKISSSGSTDIKSAISRNIKILKQCIREEKENCQTVLQDILPQCRDQLAITQQVKKELDHVKIGVALKREVYPDLASPKREISYTRFNIPRIRTHTDCEFFVAQRVKHKDADIVKHSVSIPWERGVSEKTNVSLISKGHNIYLTELDAFRQRTHKEQELWKRESISRTIRGSIVYPIMEPSHLKMTGKVAEEDMYINKKNISHLLRREDIEETNILQGSKGHKFLCTNLVVQQNMSAVQKGEAKPDDIPESIVDSVSHPNREHLQVTQPVHTKKEDVSIPMRLPVNPWRKEQSKLTDIPLRLNRPKIIFPEKLRVKQPHSSTQDKGDILESISSCILHQFHNEKLKEKVSMERMSSKVLSSVVDKASNEADTLGDPPYINLYNRKRKEHQKESTCKVLPMSVSHSSMDVLQIKLPCVKKILKPPAYHTSNTKGIGLLVEEKEHPECIHQISPKSAPHSLRDVFQSKIPREKKASEVVSIVDYVPSTEKIGPPITGKESKVQTGKGKSGMKLTSLCTSLPSLSHTNMNSRAKVGQDKSGILKSCLLPLTLQVSPNVRKISFAESINRDSLSNIQESEHLPQEKKDGENVVHVKDIMGLQRVTFKGQKTAFKHTLHGNEPQWNNKEQEKMRQKDSDLDIVKNKHYASIPSPPHVEWDPEIKEVLMRGITGFCLPSLTLQELSNAMGICEEPTDDILSSIKKAKYMPQKGRVEVALEEIRHPKIIVLKAKQTPVAQELQLNIKEKEKKLQENKDKQVGMWSESSVSISFPPYSEVDTRVKGEEAMLIKTRSSFLQTKFQESSDTGNIAYRQSINGDASTSIKKSKEYIIQEEEERVKMVQVVPLRKKKSPILQETQLDSKEQEKKIQKMKGESNIFVTNTSTCTPAPFYVQLDTRIKKADYVTEVTRYSLPELSQQKSSDAMKKASKEESTDGDIRSDVQEAKEYALQKEETNVEKSAKRDMMQPKDEDLERKQAVLQDIPLNLKEQVIVDPKGEDQGKMDGGGKGKQEVVLSSNWASESSLTYHELNTSIEGEEDIQGITKSAVSLLQLQKLVDARKIVYTKSAGDDTPNDVRGVQEYEPQREEDRRKTINMKYIMYPQSTKAKALPLPHVLYTSRSCDPQIREVQMSIKEKVRYTQERSELGKILTRPSLSQVKLNKGIEGKEEKRVTGPFLPPSWHRESSNAEKLRYTVPLLDGISNYSKRTKCMTQREEDKANNFEKDIIHPKYIGLKAKKSPLLLILKTKKLQVNMKEQEKVGQEDSKETIVLLSKIHPCVTSTHLKWNAIKDKEGEPGIIRNDAPYIEPQESLPSMEIASTEVPDSYVKKGEQRPQQEERNRVQTEASSRLLRDTDLKAKTSSPPHTCSVTEHGDLNKRKEPQWSMKEEEEEQQRTEDPDVALTKTPPSTPSPSYHRLDTRTKVDKDLLAVTGFSPSQLLCPKSSGAGKIRYADSNKGISSCNVIIKAYQCMPYTKVKDRKKIKYGEGIIFPQIITLPAETSPLPHLPSRKRLPLNIKEQGKGVPKGKSELKETYACLPSSSYLKWDTRMYEREDTLRMTQSCFPPPKIQDPSNSGKKTYTKSFDGYVLKEKGRLKTDTENKMARIHMALKAKELPLSLMLNTKKLQWKIREQERKVQKEKNDTATNLENICTSLFTLPHLKFSSTEGERYMIRITKMPLPQLQSKESPDAVKTTYVETTDTELSNGVKQLKEHTLQEEPKDREKNMDVNSLVDPTDRYLKAKKLPNLLRYNLNDLQWKTKEQEGTAQEVQHKPCGAMLTKTCICRSPLLHFSTNTRDKEKRMPILARSSLSSVSFQESSDSEDMEYIEPIASDILIIPQKGKYHMPQNKEENGVEIVNLMLPKHQEKKMQESEDESDVVVAKSSSPLPSLPRLQLDKEIQVDDEILGPTRSIVQRVSNVGEIVHTEAINDHVMKDSENRKQHGPQEEEQDREKTIDRNMMHTTDISLKSRKSPPSLMLYRTELHLNIVGQEQKKHECPGKPLGTVLRKLYVSKPPAKLTLEKGTQVNEERLRIKRPSRLPQIFSAVSDTGKRADTEAICDLREKKQHMSQKEKKHEVKTVDMRIRMDHKEARISSISHIFDTKEFVLNIKELKENMYKGKDVVLTRTFLSAPSAPPLYLDSRSKRDKDISGVTGSSPPQQNFQESSDTQKMSITEVVAGNSEIIVKKSEHSVPQEETVQQWTSNFMISVQRRNEPPRVKSEGDLSQLVLNSQPEDVYLTGFGTIRGKRLEYFFTGQEVQPDKYKTETFTTFLSYPTMDPAKIKNLKKQTEIMDSLNHKMSPKVLVSPPQKISKEIYVTFGPPASTNGFSVSEQGAHQQKTLSKASPGSADSYKFDKPEGDVHDKDKMSKIPSPKVLAPQTKGSLEKMNITGSDTAPIIEEQEIVMKKQVVLQSESGQKTWLDSSFSLKFPLQNERQKTPLEIDVHKQSTVYPRIQILPGIHMDITVFDTIGGEKKQTLPVPEQEECILESLQKSLSSHWTFPLQSGGLEGKNKTDTSTTINLEQKTLEMEEGELKIDRNIAICLGEDKTEMHKHTMVNLEENKKRDTSNTIDMNIPSLKAQKSQINTQMMTHTASSYPIKQKHKKKLEVSGAKQNIQPQKLFQKHVLDSFYAYIPLSLKLEGWKGRLTVTDLKRELSPKYLTMKIPNHPISQILNNTGRGTPSNRKKLEYDFKKPKKTILCSKDASGTFIRNLSISTMSSSQTEEIADFETNLEREKISCLSEFQKKSPNSKKKSSSAVKEGNQNFINTVPPDSQPFLVLDKQQMQKLPSVKSEANLSCETNEKILIPQTKEERVVPGHASSSIIKEPDLLMTEEEEKAPKPILTPTEYPLMSDYPKDNCTSSPDQGEKSEPIQDTTTQKVQQQKTFLGTVPIPSQVKSNEIKVVAHSTSAESSLPLCEATKNIFESQIKNIIHDKICEDILKKVKDHKPNDWKSLPCAGSPETTSTMIPPKMQSKPILERFTPKENGRLTNHLESKAFEIKLNLIPEMAKHSFQRFDFYLKQSISEDNSWRPYPRHKKVCFLSLEGIDTIELNFKQKYAKDSPPVSSLKTLIVNVSSDSEEIITKLKSTGKLEERGVSSVTSAKQMLLPHVLQNYSVEEKDKLLIHFSMKTLEIRMKAFPRIVRESYAMSNPQNIRKPLSKCIHSGIKVPKRKNRVLLIFEEKSLHQIDLDLQYKYLRFLLGLPVKSIFPKPTALPKHILKLNTVAICENIDYRGENSDDLCIDMELLEQHISFKKESPHENSSLMRKFLEPIQVCASDPDQQGTGQKDTTALSELKSHVTPGKDKQCHVWFQETDADKAFDSKAQESAPSLVDSHSTQLSEDFTGSQTNIESSANMEECSAPEAQESEECLFLEANPYLSQESQNILFELQKGIPLGNLYKMEKSKTVLKPLYREDSGSHHTRGCRKHSSIVTPSYESHKGRKYSSSSKMPSPDWLYHSSLNAVEVPSRSSSIPSGEGKTSWTARYRTSHSLAPLTESNVKLHLAKRQGKSHRHLESKERKKAKSDLCRKNNIHWDCDYSYTQNKEKCTRKKKVCHYESERSSYFPGRLELSKPYQEDISFHFERKQNQPFFYACIPADSLEIIPQTVRWTIPPRTLRKTNFRVPLVAKISSSFDIWTSSKKFLESLLGSFSPVNSN
ncbi:coiled-coil domain-containing protein 168 isoform X1 [Canis lupus familiaris]|uniref:coiled-coil domain-containing protein 168 isoform X1 n=1 Tax=Canis lupus familiaris TaxID=9615 RepID=UPI0018F7D695|nr:coiled-coil domain-containing protein 168 isoform X1 [Canis lupus familiaris]